MRGEVNFNLNGLFEFHEKRGGVGAYLRYDGHVIPRFGYQNTDNHEKNERGFVILSIFVCGKKIFLEKLVFEVFSGVFIFSKGDF